MPNIWKRVKQGAIFYVLALISPEMINAMPFTATPQLQFSERYFENFDARTNLRSDDYISSAVASLQLEYKFPQGHLGTSYSFESTYSRNNNLTNKFNGNHSGSLDYTYGARRWSAGIKGSVVSTPSGESISQLNEGVLIHGTDFLQESAGVNGKYLLSRQWDISMSYDYVNNEYTSVQYVDSETHSASSSLVETLSSFDQLALMGGVNYFRYKPGSNSKSLTSNVQWTHRAGEFTVIQAGAGVGVTTGWSVFGLFDLNLNRKIERGSVSADYSRNMGSGGGMAGTSTINQQVTVSVSKTLWQDLNGNISASYGDSIGAIPGSNYHARSWNNTVGLSYLLLKWLNSSLSYIHYDQDTEGRVTESLRSNQFLLMLSTNLSPWRPF